MSLTDSWRVESDADLLHNAFQGYPDFFLDLEEVIEQMTVWTLS